MTARRRLVPEKEVRSMVELLRSLGLKLDGPVEIRGHPMKDDICERLRHWEERTYGPDGKQVRVTEETLHEAAATIDALRAELAEANVVLRSIALLDYDHAQDGTANFEHLQSLAYRYLERTESHG